MKFHSNTYMSNVHYLQMQRIKMDTIFMNSKNSKTSNPHVLILKLTNKLDLRIGGKVIALSNRSIYYTWENIKKLIQQQ